MFLVWVPNNTSAEKACPSCFCTKQLAKIVHTKTCLGLGLYLPRVP
uniref:Uncharacterized protein n=1 Tax=Picea sitchensis TaxID=3332 RepID=A9P0Z2_PICSI|nr:unknown [Picea sitchensis]